MILVFRRGDEEDGLIGVIEGDETLLAEDELQVFLRMADTMEGEVSIEATVRRLLENSTYIFAVDVSPEQLAEMEGQVEALEQDGEIFGEELEDGIIQLFNPYHDELGRFASKEGARTTSGVGARREDRAEEKGRLEKTWSKISEVAKKAIVAPAEFLSRKNGFLSKLGRGIVEFGSDIAIFKLVQGWVFANAAPLGAAAVAALSIALFGTQAPLAALAIGGFVIGLGATLVVSEFLDWTQTKVFHAYLNRFSPKDDAHIQFSGMSAAKKAGKVYKGYSFINMMIFGSIGRAIRIMAFGEMGDIGEIIGPGLAGQYGLEDDNREATSTRAFTVAIWPHVLNVLMDDDVDEIVLPDVPALREFPGFTKRGKELVMDWDGAQEFAEHWANGDFPDVGEIKFGDTSLSIVDEKELEEYNLFNPYHDELGRFASKEGARAAPGFKYRPGARVDKKAFEGEVNRQHKQLAKKLPGTETQPKIKMTSASVRYLGAHTETRRGGLRPYTEHTIHLPHQTMYRIVKEKDGGLGHHVLLHESVHARERSERPRIGSWQEEGSTEFITRKLYKDIYGHDSTLRAYNRYVERVGRAAWQESGGDAKKAWKYVDDVHQGRVKISSWRRMDGEGWETMLGARYKFEETDDLMDQLLDFIEQKKWEEAKALVEAHPDDDNLVFVFGEMWIAEFGIGEESEPAGD